MQEKSIYSSGEFAKRANVSVRTIRYYDDKGLLKPAEIKESGYRYYTDSDFVRLQQIIVLKKLGFTLEEIADITINARDSDFVAQSFGLQLKLVRDKIAELKQIEQTIAEASFVVSEKAEPDWNKIISLIHLLNMEETLVEQYKNSKNVDARIDLHKRFSVNPQGWFPWIFDHLAIQSGMKILEVGCGNGRLWAENLAKLPDGVQITLSDISSGMLRSAKSSLKGRDQTFTYDCFDFQEIPFEEERFDIVVANHALFYAKDRDKALSEIHRVLKKEGVFCCSTYGKQHLKEIELLAKEFDERIALSEVKLYDIFGLDNGDKELSEYFSTTERCDFHDSLFVTEMLPLAEYIYSCHGNQMEHLAGRQALFEKFIQKKIGKKGLSITKDAGIFYCIK